MNARSVNIILFAACLGLLGSLAFTVYLLRVTPRPTPSTDPRVVFHTVTQKQVRVLKRGGVSNMLASVGIDRVLCIDLHAAQLQGFFDIPVDHLYAGPVMKRYFRRLNIGDLTVVAPDVGSSWLTS